MIFLLVTPAYAAEIGTIHDTPTKKGNNNLQPTYRTPKSTHTQINSPLENSNITKNKTNNNTKNTITDNPTLNELNFNLKETQNDCKEIYNPTMEIYNQTCAEIENLTQNQTKLKQEYQEVKLNNSNLLKQLKSFNTRNLTTEQEKNKTLMEEQYKKSSKSLETIENNLKNIDKEIETLNKNKNYLKNILNGLNQTMNAKTKASALPGINKIDYNMETMNLAESQINSLNEIVAKYKQNNNTTNSIKPNSIKPSILGIETGTAILLNTYTAVSLIVWKTHNTYRTTYVAGSAGRIKLFSKLFTINQDILQTNKKALEIQDLCQTVLSFKNYEGAIQGYPHMLPAEEYKLKSSIITRYRSPELKELYNKVVSDIKTLHIKGENAIEDPFKEMANLYETFGKHIDDEVEIDLLGLATFEKDEDAAMLVEKLAANAFGSEALNYKLNNAAARINFELLEMAEKEGIKGVENMELKEIEKVALETENRLEERLLERSSVFRTNFGIGAVVSVVFDIYFAASIGSLAGYELGLWEKDYVNDFVDTLFMKAANNAFKIFN